MKIKCGLDYVRGPSGTIREFDTMSDIHDFGEKTMPKDLKENGFMILPIVVFDSGFNTVRINYAKCLKGC